MDFIKKHWAYVFVGLMAVIYTIVMSYLCIRRSQAFASGYDLANMADTVWQTSQGHFFKLTGDTGLVSRFIIHTDLILVFLAPLYLLYPSPNLLLIVQALAVGISVVPIFLISKKVIKKDFLGVLIGAVFLLSPNTLWANMYDFHAVMLVIPLLFFGFYFLLIKKWLPFWIVIGLSLLTKENVGLFVAMMGVLAFFKFKEKRVGIVLFVLGMGFSVAAVKVIMPFFNGSKQHWAWGMYDFSHGIIPTVWHNLTNIDSLKYYRDLLAPYGFLPIIALPWLLPALPDLLINVTSGQGGMKSLVFHYQSLIIIALTIGLIYAFSYLVKHQKMMILAVVFLLYCSIHQNYFYSPLPTTPAHWQLMFQVGDKEINFEKALEKIPESATVASSSEVRPHVINHSLSYNLPGGALTADYVAMVSQNQLVGDYNPKLYETQLIKTLEGDPNYQTVYQDEPFYLFKKIK